MLFSLRLITATLKAHRRRSTGISRAAFEQLIADATIWEQDAKGPKVYRLANGEILKLFRRKHKFSSAALTSYARHFCHNAENLQALGIPTVNIVELLHWEGSRDTGVIYRPLPGSTVRQLAEANRADAPLMAKLGRFVARLHDKGIYFRSLHFGNVVETPDGQLGLIDIGDLKCYSRPLDRGLRARNFRHLQRLAHDWQSVTSDARLALAQGYLAEAMLSPQAKVRLMATVPLLGGQA